MGWVVSWDDPTKRLYETGIDRCVLYPMKDTISDPTKPYDDGVAWNGITSVNESPSGGEPTPLWADNIKYLNIMSAEEYGASIEAYMYPDEWLPCDGTQSVATGAYIGQQPRKQFGLSYRTILGNDAKFNDYGYKIHLVYGCIATPTEKAYSTVNDSPEASTFSWTISTIPVSVTGFKPTAHLVIDSTTVASAKLTALETILYGSSEGTPVPGRLPLPNEVISTINAT